MAYRYLFIAAIFGMVLSSASYGYAADPVPGSREPNVLIVNGQRVSKNSAQQPLPQKSVPRPPLNGNSTPYRAPTYQKDPYVGKQVVNGDKKEISKPRRVFDIR